MCDIYWYFITNSFDFLPSCCVYDTDLTGGISDVETDEDEDANGWHKKLHIIQLLYLKNDKKYKRDQHDFNRNRYNSD